MTSILSDLQQQLVGEENDGLHFKIPQLDSDYKKYDESSSSSYPDRDNNGDGTTVQVPHYIIKDLLYYQMFFQTMVWVHSCLEDVLRGVYDRGRKPDKVPRLIKGNKPQS